MKVGPSSRRAVYGLCLVMALSSLGQAQNPTVVPALPEGLGDDPRANETFRLIQQGKEIAARESAERILKEDPDSFRGHFLLGKVLYEAEGNLPRAYYHLKRSRELFESTYGSRPTGDVPWRWHVMVLSELREVVGTMARFEESLDILAAYDAFYVPKRPALRAWPLLRLGRYEEARRAVLAGLASSDPEHVSYARTSLCNLEWELQNRQAAYDACLAAAQHASGHDSAVELTNISDASASLLKMDEAESFAIEATHHYSRTAVANPWLTLTWLYLAQGRTAEAISTARDMLRWEAGQEPAMAEEHAALVQHTAALFLLVMGLGEEAANVTGKALRQPDRVSHASENIAQRAGATALIDRRAHLVAAERKKEEASWASWTDAWTARFSSWKHRFWAWSAGQRASALLHDERRLVSTFRPYLAGGIDLPEWLRGDLGEVIGAGVATAALEKARRAETFEGAEGYFEAHAAQLAFLKSDGAQARQHAERALARLPRSEVLLQARVAAIAGHAARESGDETAALHFYLRAFQREPGVFRRLGLELPCRFFASGGVVAKRAEDFLEESPRFQEVRGPSFQVQIQGTDTSASACLVGPTGEQLSCSQVTARAGEDAKALARRLAAEFHADTFAPKVDLSQEDLRSLDGSTTVGARQPRALDGLFKSLSDEGLSPAP